MRGKGRLGHEAYSCDRITPAYAGKSGAGFDFTGFSEDHPRLCGEKHATAEEIQEIDGITPAYAGKRKGTFASIIPREDHPRLCGEKLIAISIFLCASGSPPPMRGKVVRYDEFAFYSGITPAYAGKSLSGLSVRLLYRDHPRLCGEKHSTLVIRSRRLGSPPPMRGKDEFDMDEVDDARITPAYAGKSSPHTYPQ